MANYLKNIFCGEEYFGPPPLEVHIDLFDSVYQILLHSKLFVSNS